MRKPKRTDRRRRRKPQKPHRDGRASGTWSAAVTRNSNALDLEPKVFAKKTPGAIARSLARSAEASDRRKGSPFRSAMSMLNFYINRAGSRLSQSRREVLQRAKGALRRAFGRSPGG